MASKEPSKVSLSKKRNPSCLISNTVRTRLLAQPLSEAARAAVERAKWLEARQCWVMDVPPWATLRELEDVCASPGSATWAQLDTERPCLMAGALSLALCTGRAYAWDMNGNSPLARGATDDLGDLLRASSAIMIHLTSRALGSVDEPVSFPQLRTLIAVWRVEESEQMTLSALARVLEVSPSTAMRMCDRLKKMGLLTRASPPGRKRETVCVLTPKGHTVLTEILEERTRYLSDIIDRLTLEEQEKVIEATRLFVRASKLEHPPL